jgi:hypothetical protein
LLNHCIEVRQSGRRGSTGEKRLKAPEQFINAIDVPIDKQSSVKSGVRTFWHPYSLINDNTKRNKKLIRPLQFKRRPVPAKRLWCLSGHHNIEVAGTNKLSRQGGTQILPSDLPAPNPFYNSSFSDPAE